MLIAATIEGAPWRPDFAGSGARSPRWTRLLCGDVQLVNAIEDVDWTQDPVQVVLCEQCGHTDCADGGYVRVARLGQHVLWTTPRFDGVESYTEEDARARFSAPLAITRHGSVAVPIAVWDDLSARYRSVPDAVALTPATRWHVRQAWLAEAHPGQRSSVDPGDVLRRDLIAVDQGSLEEAAVVARRLWTWLDAAPDAVVDGELVPLSAARANQVTLYLDHPDRPWPAFALVDQTPVLSFGRELILVGPP